METGEDIDNTDDNQEQNGEEIQEEVEVEELLVEEDAKKTPTEEEGNFVQTQAEGEKMDTHNLGEENEKEEHNGNDGIPDDRNQEGHSSENIQKEIDGNDNDDSAAEGNVGSETKDDQSAHTSNSKNSAEAMPSESLQRRREANAVNANTKGVSFAGKVDEKGVEEEDDSYQSRRYRIFVTIDTPDSKDEMLIKLAKAINEQVLGKAQLALNRLDESSSKEFYLREFTDRTTPRIRSKELKKWITTLPEKPSMELFRTYFQGGVNPKGKCRGGSFYFRINTTFPSTFDLSQVLTELQFQIDTQGERGISDILSQNITTPTELGFLFRSTNKMTQSDDLVNAIQRTCIMPGVYFGMTFGNINLPWGHKKLERSRQPKGVKIETNENTVEQATNHLLKLFPHR